MPEPSKPNYRLRERRKVKTRSSLMKAAGELFARQGFEKTTLEEIATRADVHVQTLYSHFSNKETLAVAVDWQGLEVFKEQLAAEPPDNFMDFWRNWVTEAGERAQKRAPKAMLQRLKDIGTVPSLSGMTLTVWNGYLQLITEQLAKQMGTSAASSRMPHLFACMLWGGHQSAVARWAASEASIDLVQELGAVVDEVSNVLDTWLNAQGKAA